MDGSTTRSENEYYQNKLQTLSQLFPTSDVRLETNALIVGDKSYPIVDDVIILIDPEQYPRKVKDALNKREQHQTGSRDLVGPELHGDGAESKMADRYHICPHQRRLAVPGDGVRCV